MLFKCLSTLRQYCQLRVNTALQKNQCFCHELHVELLNALCSNTFFELLLHLEFVITDRQLLGKLEICKHTIIIKNTVTIKIIIFIM